MNADQRKNLKTQLDKLTRPQLISLATQKNVLPYREAKIKSKEDLIEACLPVEGVLKPEQA